MANGPLTELLSHLRRAVGPEARTGPTDAELLRRFVAQTDEAAFELLAWRHSALVLGVCRRVLRHHQDAEDAFQATFLVLARKGRSLRQRDSVGAWLYRVAYRTALRARARRRPSEGPASALAEVPSPRPGPEAEAEAAELREALDEAIDGLPERYRVPVVLCHLEGLSNAEAAGELGCPVGTLEARLSRARQRLKEALQRRGLTLPARAPLLAAAWGALMSPTVKAAAAVAAGKRALAAHLAPGALTLAEEVLTSMFVTKCKFVVAFVLALGLVGTGAGGVAYHAAAGDGGSLKEVAAPATGERPASAERRAPAPGDKKPAERPKEAAPKPPAAKEAVSPDGRLRATADGKVVVLTDVATNKEVRRTLAHSQDVSALAFSPDGKMLYSGDTGGTVCNAQVATGKLIWKYVGKGQVSALGASPDGKTLTVDLNGKAAFLIDGATGKRLAAGFPGKGE